MRLSPRFPGWLSPVADDGSTKGVRNTLPGTSDQIGKFCLILQQAVIPAEILVGLVSPRKKEIRPVAPFHLVPFAMEPVVASDVEVRLL